MTVPFTKEAFVSTINSYTAAVVSGDDTLIEFGAKLLHQHIDKITFAEITVIEQVTPKAVAPAPEKEEDLEITEDQLLEKLNTILVRLRKENG